MGLASFASDYEEITYKNTTHQHIGIVTRSHAILNLYSVLLARGSTRRHWCSASRTHIARSVWDGSRRPHVLAVLPRSRGRTMRPRSFAGWTRLLHRLNRPLVSRT